MTQLVTQAIPKSRVYSHVLIWSLLTRSLLLRKVQSREKQTAQLLAMQSCCFSPCMCMIPNVSQHIVADTVLCQLEPKRVALNCNFTHVFQAKSLKYLLAWHLKVWVYTDDHFDCVNQMFMKMQTLEERCFLSSPCFCLNWCTQGPRQPVQCCSPRSQAGWSSQSSGD